MTHQPPLTDHKIEPEKQSKDNDVIVRSFNDLEDKRIMLQQTVKSGHQKTSELISQMLYSTSQLISFIKEEKEEFERKNDSFE